MPEAPISSSAPYRATASSSNRSRFPPTPTGSTAASKRWSRDSRTVISRLPEQPAAISFAFPGPADYPRGIIGGYLPNFPSFRDGVALKDFLEERFGIPTFINNDGDLYAYGEALGVHCPKSTPGSKPQEAPNASAT